MKRPWDYWLILVYLFLYLPSGAAAWVFLVDKVPQEVFQSTVSVKTILLIAFPLLGLSILVGAVWRRRPKNTVTESDAQPEARFFSSRDQMQQSTGGLAAELVDLTEAWAAFEIGSHFVALDDALKRRLRRIILLHPGEEAVLSRWTEFDESTDRAKATIHEATRRAQRLGLEVRWYRGPLLNVIIGEPDQGNGWARVQSQLPHIQSARWPNYKISRNTEPELFLSIRESYEAMWERSEPPGEATSTVVQGELGIRIHRVRVRDGSELGLTGLAAHHPVLEATVQVFPSMPMTYQHTELQIGEEKFLPITRLEADPTPRNFPSSLEYDLYATLLFSVPAEKISVNVQCRILVTTSDREWSSAPITLVEGAYSLG